MVEEPKKYTISITVDTNDADYLTEVSEISEEELALILPLIKVIAQRDKNVQIRNYSTSEYESGPSGREIYNCDKEVFEAFESLCPYGEYGFHTIEEIKIAPLVVWEKLL
jgi:hypothetical protein